MKNNYWLFAAGIFTLGFFTISCRPAAARPPQASLQEPAPPPPPPAYAAAPSPSPDDPPPPRRGRRPGPPPPAACGPEAPPPPPTAAASPTTPAITVRNTIRQFNFGPEGEISGFLLSNGMQVNLPPEVSEQFPSLAKLKSEVSISGYPRQTASGKTILDATSITAGGQSIMIPTQPAGPRTAPPPPAQPGPPQN